MSEAKYMTGVDSLQVSDTDDLIDQFVTTVLTTADLMQMVAEHDGIQIEALGRAAADLWSEALYVRRRLDRESEVQVAEFKKTRPELFEHQN